MDRCLPHQDTIESQPVMDVPQHRRYFSINPIKRRIFRTLCSLGFLQAGGEDMPPMGDTEPVPDFFTNIKFSDFLAFPGEYLPMSPEIFSAVSAGKKEWLDKLRSDVEPIACLKSDQGDSVLHLAAAWGHLELVQSIVYECPCLLLELDSRDQLPLHVAARAGHLQVVRSIIAILKFVSANLSEDEEGKMNLYVVKDRNGNTPLHLALKSHRMMTATYLVSANQRASFLADKDGISPLYLAVEAGDVSLVKAMLKSAHNEGLQGRNTNLESHLEGRKCVVHAALKARSTDILEVILREYPSLENERDGEGMTCLSFGASIGFYDGVCKLLDRSTKSVYVCNDDGSFPIHVAVENRHMGVVFELLKRCPDSKHLLNKQGQNILHIASKNGKVIVFMYLYFWRTGWITWINELVERQDVDGNTPLHLATINWRPRTLFLLIVKYHGNCLYTRNNNGLTALDIAESNLKPNYIFMERVTLMVLLYFNASFSRRFLGMFTKKITKRSDPPHGDKSKDYVNTLLVVAALVATVTFAAGFTIPGGFNSSASNLGMATLANDPKLVFFMVFDTLAMQSSMVTIAILIWAQLGDPALVHLSLVASLPPLFFSLFCMLVAFYFGVFAVFAHVKGLVIFLNVTSAFFLFLMLFLLGPHVFLKIPGIPAAFGAYFLLFVLLVDENSDAHVSAARISSNEHEASAATSSGKDLIQKKES